MLGLDRKSSQADAGSSAGTSAEEPSTALVLRQNTVPPSTSSSNVVIPSLDHKSLSFKDRWPIWTKTDSLSSGFPFDERLFDLGVTHDDWHLFSSEIVKASSLSLKEDAAAWTVGVGGGTLVVPLVLIFAPVLGFYSGKSIHRKAVVKKVEKQLMRDGALRGILKNWNDEVFRKNGFQAWLELPTLKDEVKEPKVKGEDSDDKKARKKLEKLKATRFRIVIIPTLQGERVPPMPALPSPNVSPLPAKSSLAARLPQPPINYTPVEAPADREAAEVQAESLGAAELDSAELDRSEIVSAVSESPVPPPYQLKRDSTMQNNNPTPTSPSAVSSMTA